jgi:hypothetical protein
VEHEGVTTVVARRCFPELWDALGAPEWPILVAGLAEAGVRRVVLEGRKVSHRTVHPLGCATQEVAALAPVFRGRARGPFGVANLAV